MKLSDENNDEAKSQKESVTEAAVENLSSLDNSKSGPVVPLDQCQLDTKEIADAILINIQCHQTNVTSDKPFVRLKSNIYLLRIWTKAMSSKINFTSDEYYLLKITYKPLQIWCSCVDRRRLAYDCIHIPVVRHILSGLPVSEDL